MTVNGRCEPEARPSTINELCDRYLAHAEDYYRSPPDAAGRRLPTGETSNLRSGLRALRAVAGPRPPWTARAEDLCAVEQWLLGRRTGRGEPLTREYINKCCMMIRRCFRWAAKPPQRWLPVIVLEDLRLFEPLPYGRSIARPSADIEPVPEEDFRATLAALGQLSEIRHRAQQALCLQQMLDLHWHTGMRPGELVTINRWELSTERVQLTLFDREIEVMVYRPKQHKTRYRGFDRNIFLGPEAQRIIEDWLPRADADGRLFQYTTGSYRQAVRRINRQFKIAAWTPNQIRHAFATRMRTASGIDVVQVLMGHRHRSTTEIYAKPDAAAAIDAIFRYA